MKLPEPSPRLLGFLVVAASVLVILSSYLGWAQVLRPPVQTGSVKTAFESIVETKMVDPSRDVGEVISDTGQQATTLDRQLRDLTFDYVSVDSTGRVSEKHSGRARYYTEDLGMSAKLDMVQIAAGKFLMGVSFAEAALVSQEYRRHMGSDENLNHYGNELVAMQVPQRPVNVQGFFLGRFEVTQAQWRFVAELPKVSRDIDVDPALFKGDDLPVEEVTWEDAIEFCARLSRATRKDYRLPSEAEWEYACRAGTKTQFYFGDTITTELVNYNGDYPYGLAPKGENRGRTVPVGSLGSPNAFGLSDMHGNVREWCMDPWHENYNNAPWDGRVWNNPGGSVWTGCGADYRVVRGGSWLQGPDTSAHRSRLWWTNNKNYFTGFRVVCSAP